MPEDTLASRRATEIARAYFDHPTDPKPKYDESDSWGVDDESWAFREKLEAWIEFFGHFDRYAAPYSFSQVDQGLWVIASVEGPLRDDLIDPYGADPDYPLAVALFLSMPRMYTHYLIEAQDAPELAFHMWWDCLAFPAARLEKGEFSDLGTTSVRDAHLAALEVILATDDSHCQYCALQGLGHLEHPRRAAVVTQFIESEREAGRLDGWRIEWLEECRDGTVM